MGGKLLLADDSITIQKVVELTFAETGHEVVAVGSGRELLSRVGEVRPDVVLCDVVMPDVNGYDVCQELKSSPETLHIPVVLLTGTFEPFDRNRALAVGCDAIITKPFEADELVRTVEDLMKKPAVPQDGEAGSEAPGAASEGVEGIDFTTTGFDAMTAKADDVTAELPEQGIDFTRTGFDTPETAPSGEAFEEEAPEPGGGATAEAEDEPREVAEEERRAVEAAEELETGDPFEFGESAVEEPAPGPLAGSDVESPADTVSAAAASDEVAAPEVMQAAEADEAEQPPEEVTAVSTEEAPEQPLVAEAVAGTRHDGTLSDEDVERVARKVLELAHPMLERLAWEIVPDMAEMLVRQRIIELEEAAERGE